MTSYRIYVDGKLRLVCGSQFVLMNNVINFIEKYGKDRVEVREVESNDLDKIELQQLREVIGNIRQ